MPFAMRLSLVAMTSFVFFWTQATFLDAATISQNVFKFGILACHKLDQLVDLENLAALITYSRCRLLMLSSLFDLTVFASHLLSHYIPFCWHT